MIDFVKDKWPILLAWNLCIFLVWYAYGCEPKTTSLIDPGQKITLEQLQNEVDILMLKSETRLNDLQKQYELRDFVFNQSIKIAETGTINPIGVITSLLAVMGIGLGADDLRLRKERKKTLTYEPNVQNTN